MTIEQAHQIENNEDIQNDMDVLQNALNETGTHNLDNQDYAREVGDELNSDDELNQIIENIKDENETNRILTSDEFIKRIQELGIEIDGNDIKDIETNEEGINKIKTIQELGIKINGNDIKDIVKLKENEIHNILKMKNKGIDLGINYINIRNNKKIDITQQNIKNKIELIQKLKVKICIWDIKEIQDAEITEEIINKIELLKNIGTNISLHDILDICENNINITITREQTENLKKIKYDLKIDFGINEINQIKTITGEQIKNLKTIKNNFKIDFGINEITEIKEITETDIKNLERLHQLGITNNLNFIDLININEKEIRILENTSAIDYDGYNYNNREFEINSYKYYKKGRIIESIEDFIQNTIKENRDISREEILEKIRSDLVTLPIKEKLNIINGINKVVLKFNTVRKYLEFKEPYSTPKKLLCAIRGITSPSIISQITDDITVKQHGTGFVFFVGNTESYYLIYGLGSKEGVGSGGFNRAGSEIPGLEGTLSVVKGKDSGQNEDNRKIWHEGQHNRNSYFMTDNDKNKPIVLAKDEITAYLRDGKNKIIVRDDNTNGDNMENSIYGILTTNKLYRYNQDGEAWEKHKSEVKRLCEYATDLIELTKDEKIGLKRDELISMLSYTPVEERENLHNNILQAVENYKKNPNKQIDFRRNGTETKENLITKLKGCKNIENLIHTLKDPRYSHIGLGPDNLGGIEISNIINEVIAGNLTIDYIPIEIRQHIQNRIK